MKVCQAMSKRLAFPFVGWMVLFVIAPLFIILFFAFTTSEGNFSFVNIINIGDYTKVFLRSMNLAVIATFICLIIGYPLAYAISRETPVIQNIAMLLIMLPMWINFLLRTYAWMSILEDTGLLNRFLGLLHIPPVHIINTEGAVVLGMVYNYLPFMILPIFTVIVKIHGSVIEAAQDLGGNSLTVFKRVIFPLSLPGVLSGVTMVFVPSISTFVISKLLGGGKKLLLGDLIEMQFLGNSYNLHLGSAISIVMLLMVLLCIVIMNKFGDKGDVVLI